MLVNDLDLAKQANKAKEFAHSPYYKFRVGAALLLKDGMVYNGCNLETGAGNTICAERVAMSKALSEGKTDFVAIAVASDQNHFISPCGLCRQFMMEFAPNLKVIMYDGNGTKAVTLKELLPYSFNISE